MKSLKVILFSIYLFSFGVVARANGSGIAANWSIEQRCIEKPEKHADDWMFEGTIFTHQISQGIRARRSDFPVTYFVSYDRKNFDVVGSFSPDGKYYAVPAGRLTPGDSYRNLVIYDEIRIYTTGIDTKLFRTIPIDQSNIIYELGYTFWLDNERLVFYDRGPAYIIDISASTISLIQPETIDRSILSFDMTRAIGIWSDGNIFRRGLVDISENQLLKEVTPKRVYWSPDSSLWAGIIDENNTEILKLIGRDGEPTEPIYYFGSDTYFTHFSWSHDNQNFLLGMYTVTGDYVVSGYHTFLGDIAGRKFIDLCVETEDAIFSFNDKYLALNGRMENRLYIFDLSTHILHLVGNSTGSLVAWLPNENGNQ